MGLGRFSKASDTREVPNMDNKPELRSWNLYFPLDDGLENRMNVMKAFMDFLQNPDADELKVPGNCVLGGDVYGRAGVADGVMVVTSYVRYIKRLERGYAFGNPNDLMRAVTASGSVYYFYSRTHDAFMQMMMGDIINRGRLDPRPGRYRHRDFSGKNFL